MNNKIVVYAILGCICCISAGLMVESVKDFVMILIFFVGCKFNDYAIAKL